MTMTISELQFLQNPDPFGTDDPLALPQIDYGSQGVGRDTVFDRALDQVDERQKVAGQQIEAFVAGEQENLHEVMIASSQARLSFQLMVEVRNKMMEAYQELFRMQI